MNKRRLVSVFTFVLAQSACSTILLQHKNSVNNVPISALEVLSVTMSRSACYGLCPVYSVTVNFDGSVAFDGIENVKIKGVSHGSIAKEEFSYLARSVERFQFFSWKELYGSKSDGCISVSTDNPAVEILVATKNQNKSVSYYYGCRGLPLASKIDLLSNIIDDVAETSKWVGVED